MQDKIRVRARSDRPSELSLVGPGDKVIKTMMFDSRIDSDRRQVARSLARWAVKHGYYLDPTEYIRLVTFVDNGLGDPLSVGPNVHYVLPHCCRTCKHYSFTCNDFDKSWFREVGSRCTKYDTPRFEPGDTILPLTMVCDDWENG